jgi:DNA replication and repair protein RecF
VLLRHLSLRHYRNYAALDAAFQPGLVLLNGANAQGKTNLLEAIYLLATTKSARARSDGELISWAERDPLSPTAFARLVGQVERGGADYTM